MGVLKPLRVPHSRLQTGSFNLEDPEWGMVGVRLTAIRCANPACGKVAIDTTVRPWVRPMMGEQVFAHGKPILARRLLPENTAKPQPIYIPPPIVEGYREACLICDLSPKAAATLARRCLQGMIRDFCKICDDSLNREIIRLREQIGSGKAPPDVTKASVDAIDRVRKIGNFGAHMEKDINLIVDIEPGEARLLIELIEILFKDWYVRRHEREENLTRLAKITDAKNSLANRMPPDEG